MTTLVVSRSNFADLTSGYDLRAWFLSQQLAKLDSLVMVRLLCAVEGRGDVSRDPRDLFCEVIPLAPRLGRPSIFRHLRWHDASYYFLGHPSFRRQAIELISSTLRRHSASRIVVLGGGLTDFLMPFRSEKVLIDVCDSRSLTLERNAIVGSSMTVREKVNTALFCWRCNNTERRLPHWFTHVMTANDADTQTIKRLSGGCENVTTIPNGVSPALEHPITNKSMRPKRGVVFWGNLAFRPNASAIRFFFEKVFEPYLVPQGVEWCIVGRDAEPWLKAASTRYPLIRLTGFVEDLYAAVSEYPVFVNSMISGAGIKNKVLEAFALEKAVVSTPLGIESISGAVKGVHYEEAATPEQMAQTVLALLDTPARCRGLGSNARQLILAQHTWRHVGEKLRLVLEAM